MIKRILICCFVLMLMAFAGSAWAAGNTSYAGEEWVVANSYNTLIGDGAGNSNTGSSNNFIGYQAGYTNTNGYNNNFLGYHAGYANSTASGNNFVGYEAGQSNTTGAGNDFFGYQAGYGNTSGSNNAFFGTSAGYMNTTESNNTFIGSKTNMYGGASITNATAIGSNAYVTQSNSVVLGSIAGVNLATSSVNVGIGTSAPVRQLHLAGSNAVFRMDRTADTAAFMLVRTDGIGNPQKTFVVGANSSGAGVGTFVINDLGTAVSGGGTNRMTINNDGSVTFTGNVYANSFVPSSIAYKDNVRTYENALDTVNKLRGVRFDWKDSGKPSVGLIAEEVEKVVPEVVAHDEGNATGVNYASLVGVLVEAVKEQQAQHHAELTEQKKQHQVEMDSLRAEIQQLKTLLQGR